MKFLFMRGMIFDRRISLVSTNEERSTKKVKEPRTQKRSLAASCLFTKKGKIDQKKASVRKGFRQTFLMQVIFVKEQSFLFQTEEAFTAVYRNSYFEKGVKPVENAKNSNDTNTVFSYHDCNLLRVKKTFATIHLASRQNK